MKIVMLEPIGISDEELNEYASKFEKKDHEFISYNNRVEDEDEIIKRAKDANVLIITNLPLSAEVIKACPELQMISVAFTGVDHIAIDVCEEREITVCNSSGYANKAVAELSFGLMISVLRSLPACDKATRTKKTRAGLVGNEIAGKTLGIVGAGAIGMEVAKLGKAFGCQLLAFNRSKNETAKELGMEYVALDTLLKQSDIVSLHLPLTAETNGLISKEKIELMKPSSILINVARGAIVDNKALAGALKDGKIAGAGIDVFEMEPPIPEDYPLLDAPNTVLSPHVAFATDESFQKRAKIVFANIKSWLAKEPINLIV